MIPIFISTINNSADRSFAESLYIQHKMKIYKTAYKILNNEQDAEDATSETFIKIVDTLQNYYDKSENELAGIFVTIAKNTAIDKYRRNNKIEFIEMAEEYVPENEYDKIGDFIVKKELYENLYKAVEMLDEDYKQIIKLKLLYDYSDKKIAEVLNISDVNVRVRHHRAKKILSAYLKGANEDENE